MVKKKFMIMIILFSSLFDWSNFVFVCTVTYTDTCHDYGSFFLLKIQRNKAGYTAALVACGWAVAVLEKVTRASGQEPYAQKAQKRRKSK